MRLHVTLLGALLISTTTFAAGLIEIAPPSGSDPDEIKMIRGYRDDILEAGLNGGFNARSSESAIQYRSDTDSRGDWRQAILMNAKQKCDVSLVGHFSGRHYVAVCSPRSQSWGEWFSSIVKGL